MSATPKAFSKNTILYNSRTSKLDSLPANEALYLLDYRKSNGDKRTLVVTGYSGVKTIVNVLWNVKLQALVSEWQDVLGQLDV